MDEILGHRHLSLVFFRMVLGCQTDEVKANSPGHCHCRSSQAVNQGQQSPESNMRAIVLSFTAVIAPEKGKVRGLVMAIIRAQATIHATIRAI